MNLFLAIVLQLILFSSFVTYSQSYPAQYFPPFHERPAFKLEESVDSDSEYEQTDLFKSYTSLYLHNKFQRLIARDALTSYYNYVSLFSSKDFKLFQIFQNKRAPKIENDLAFENDPIDFSNLIVDDLGVCMGVTSVIRKFNMLAHFDPQNTFKAKVPIRQTHEKEWIAFYQKLIDKVMSNIPTVIPYFHDLEEISSYGNFYTYLQRHSLDQWALNNMTIQAGAAQMLLGVKTVFNKIDGYFLYSTLKKRLNRYYNPKVFLAQPGSFNKKEDIWIHVMQVYDLTPMNRDGSYQIKLWDPNFPANHELSKAVVDITKDGKALFHDEDGTLTKLSAIDLYKWDDAEIAEILLNYQPFCKKYPTICQK